MVFSKAGDTSYLCDKIKICNMSITVSLIESVLKVIMKKEKEKNIKFQLMK